MNRSVCALLLLLVCLGACGPAIRAFSVTPLTVSDPDSVQVRWKARGHPVLLFHRKPFRAAADSMELWEFTLVAGKEKRMIQVAVVPVQSREEVVFATELRGDTLVAAGVKDTVRWSPSFRVLSLSSDRPLLVTHEGRTVQLAGAGILSDGFGGLPLRGYWEMRCGLTGSEKKDRATLPEVLHVTVTIQRLKQP